MNELTDFRKQIDVIDKKIVDLLAERLKTVEKIFRYKKQNNIPFLDKDRWQKVLDRNQKQAEKVGLDRELITKVYNLIHNYLLKKDKR